MMTTSLLSARKALISRYSESYADCIMLSSVKTQSGNAGWVAPDPVPFSRVKISVFIDHL